MIQKNIIKTKEDYERIVIMSNNLLNSTKELRGRPFIEANALYYESFIGLIRAGTLIKRTTDTDGLPIISLLISGNEFYCREDTLKSLMGNDYLQLIHPYEDTSDSCISIINETPFELPNFEEEKKKVDILSIAKQATTKISSVKKEKEEENDYDPDYDHVYDEILPQVQEELEKTKTDGITKIISMLLSITAIVACVLLLKF